MRSLGNSLSVSKIRQRVQFGQEVRSQENSSVFQTSYVFMVDYNDKSNLKNGFTFTSKQTTNPTKITRSKMFF